MARGFSFIEFLVWAAILCIIAAFAVPTWQRWRDQRSRPKDELDLQLMGQKDGCRIYQFRAHGYYQVITTCSGCPAEKP